ncbi:MAG: cell division protein ZapB [Treponema sp.]|jgi:chromosome segregation ATPase|nr:cell division protein ZapB [Treponema sp.]
MGILENVKVLETKVDKEIDFARRLMEENVQLKEKVSLYQKRIEDLESLIQAFKEEQSAIENGILSALNRLNQFEDAVEKRLASAGQDSPEQAGAESPEQEAAPSSDKPRPEGEAVPVNGGSEGNPDQPYDATE